MDAGPSTLSETAAAPLFEPELEMQPEIVAGPSNTLPQTTQDSIDLTGDSDDGVDSTPQVPDVSRPSQNGQQVGLNGFSGGPSVMNGHGQAGPSNQQQPYPSYFSKGPLRPTFGAPSFASHSPNGQGQGNIHPPPNYFTTSYPTPLNPSNNTNGQYSLSQSQSHFQSPFNQSSNIYSPRQPLAGPSSSDGLSSSSAIDLTSNLPSPAPQHNPKKPIFIGAITTDVFMLYPSPIVYIGATCQDNKERLEVVQYRGAEFLKVKLKVCRDWKKVADDSIDKLDLNRRRRINGYRQVETSCRS